MGIKLTTCTILSAFQVGISAFQHGLKASFVHPSCIEFLSFSHNPETVPLGMSLVCKQEGFPEKQTLTV